jgi:hypothetical protein
MVSELMAGDAMPAEMQCQLRKNARLNILAAIAPLIMAPLITEPLQHRGCIDNGAIAASELH